MRKKRVIIEQLVNDIKPGSNKKQLLMSELLNLGIKSVDESGVIIALSTEQNLNNVSNSMKYCMDKAGYDSSWGIRIVGDGTTAEKQIKLW